MNFSFSDLNSMGFGSQLIELIIGGGTISNKTESLLSIVTSSISLIILVIGLLVVLAKALEYLLKSASHLKMGGDGVNRVYNIFGPAQILIFFFLVAPSYQGYPSVVYLYKAVAEFGSNLGDNSANAVDKYFTSGHTIISPYALQTSDIGKSLADAAICAAISNSIDGVESVTPQSSVVGNRVEFYLADKSNRDRCSYQIVYNLSNADVSNLFYQSLNEGSQIFGIYSDVYNKVYPVINDYYRKYLDLRNNAITDPRSLSSFLSPEEMSKNSSWLSSNVYIPLYNYSSAAAFSALTKIMANVHGEINNSNFPNYLNDADGKDYNAALGWIGIATRYWAISKRNAENLSESSIAITVNNQPVAMPNDLKNDLVPLWKQASIDASNSVQRASDNAFNDALEANLKDAKTNLKAQLSSLDATGLAQVVAGTSGKGLTTESSGNTTILPPIKIDFGIDSSTYLDRDGNIVGRLFARAANIGQMAGMGIISHYINADDPFLAIVDSGHYLMDLGEAIKLCILPLESTAEAVGETDGWADATTGGVLGKIVSWLPGGGLIKKAADVAVKSVATMIAHFLTMLDQIAWWMIILGAFMAFYLPLIPMISWLEVVVIWLLSTAEACVLSIVWPLVFVMELGTETLHPQRSHLGFNMLVTILMLPMLCVAGFAMMLTVMNPLLKIALLLYTYASIDTLATANVSGIPTFFAITGIGALIAFNVIQRVSQVQLEYIGKAIRWLGGQVDLAADGVENSIRSEFMRSRQDINGRFGGK